MVTGAEELFFGVGIDETNRDAFRQLYLYVQQLQAAGFSKDDALKLMAEIVAAKMK